MARKSNFSKEIIVKKCIDIVKKKGFDALTARTVGAALGSSPRPIFTFYSSMDELREDVEIEASNIFVKASAECLDYKPAFKEFGRRVVRFAETEPNLFKLVFLSDNGLADHTTAIQEQCKSMVMDEAGLNEEATNHVLHMVSTFALGMAANALSGAKKYTDDELNSLLALAFRGAVSTLTTEQSTLADTPEKVKNLRGRKKSK